MYGSLLDSLIGVTWPARRPKGTGAAGIHPSRLRGMTAEFTEYRLYRQGDDPRRLDWKLLARTDRPYLRITDDHSIRATMMLLDGTASLGFPSDTLGKWNQARRLVVGLASVARSGGDPVGLAVASDAGLVRIPPRTRQGVIGEIVRGLENIIPRGSTSMVPALRGVRPGWRVVIVSDFLGEENALRTAAAGLIVEGVEIFALHVVADEEIAPAFAVRLATDPEDPAARRVFHGAVRADYISQFAAWRSELATRWRSIGAEYTEIRAEEDTAAAIRRIVRPV